MTKTISILITVFSLLLLLNPSVRSETISTENPLEKKGILSFNNYNDAFPYIIAAKPRKKKTKKKPKSGGGKRENKSKSRKRPKDMLKPASDYVIKRTVGFEIGGPSLLLFDFNNSHLSCLGLGVSMEQYYTEKLYWKMGFNYSRMNMHSWIGEDTSDFIFQYYLYDKTSGLSGGNNGLSIINQVSYILFNSAITPLVSFGFGLYIVDDNAASAPHSKPLNLIFHLGIGGKYRIDDHTDIHLEVDLTNAVLRTVDNEKYYLYSIGLGINQKVSLGCCL